jgi:hypothetical protein
MSRKIPDEVRTHQVPVVVLTSAWKVVDPRRPDALRPFWGWWLGCSPAATPGAAIPPFCWAPATERSSIWRVRCRCRDFLPPSWCRSGATEIHTVPTRRSGSASRSCPTCCTATPTSGYTCTSRAGRAHGRLNDLLPQLVEASTGGLPGVPGRFADISGDGHPRRGHVNLADTTRQRLPHVPNRRRGRRVAGWRRPSRGCGDAHTRLPRPGPPAIPARHRPPRTLRTRPGPAARGHPTLVTAAGRARAPRTVPVVWTSAPEARYDSPAAPARCSARRKDGCRTGQRGHSRSSAADALDRLMLRLSTFGAGVGHVGECGQIRFHPGFDGAGEPCRPLAHT